MNCGLWAVLPERRIAAKDEALQGLIDRWFKVLFSHTLRIFPT